MSFLDMECVYATRFAPSVRRLETYNMSTPGLRFIQKYIHRNPYTGAACFDEADAEGSREFRELLRKVWESGYEAGFADGDGDSYVETQTSNPYA